MEILDNQYRAARQEENRKTTKKVSGCSEEGHAEEDTRDGVTWRQVIYCGYP